ncbi:MAG: hypothetical protein DMD91_14855 [Candidatus Rokuibacteriota bacterium]|nr:MAG: hypothetical protein DMD91_14855 [Candidatus Rokubacteria bacterium]
MSVPFLVLMLVLALLVTGAVLIIRLRPEQDVQIVFAKAYLKTYRGTRDRKESLLAALAVVRKRAPFSDVSDEDAAFLADLFGRLHHPHVVLGQVLQSADHKQSVGSLRNRAHLQVVIDGAEAQGA